MKILDVLVKEVQLNASERERSATFSISKALDDSWPGPDL
jgi:hypothetical protein